MPCVLSCVYYMSLVVISYGCAICHIIFVGAVRPFVNISIPKSLYIYCFIFYIDIYYDYMYLLLDHVVFVYYYASNGNLMEIYTVINIVKILLRIKMPFMNIRLSTNISLEYLPFLLLYPMCVYTYIIMYVHVYTHKIDSTSPVNQHWGTLFLLAENISYIFHKNEIFIYF